jgi:RNA polymerase sigma factor (sigma-70 family)
MDRLTRCFLDIRDELLRLLTRRTGRAAAEDVLQDVWVNLRESGDPDAWREPRAVLFTTAANLATDAGRRRSTADLHRARESRPEEAACPAPGPEAQAETAEDLERLQWALAELPPACREAFLLNRLESLSHKEIAARLQISTKSVQRYIERALRHCLRAVDD